MPVKPAPVAVLAVLLLSGCAAAGDPPRTASPAAPSAPATGSSADGGQTSSSSPSPSAVTASPSPQLVATIPTDCRALVPAERYDAIFGDTPLNDPYWIEPGYAGAVEPVTSPPGSSAQTVLTDATQLRCHWGHPQTDVTGVTVEVAQVDPAIAEVHLEDREVAGGYTCETVYEGRRCQLVSRSEQYPVEQGMTLFLRGDVYIFVNQANFPTDDLLGDIVASIWR